MPLIKETSLPQNLTLHLTSGTVTALVNIAHLVEGLDASTSLNQFQSMFTGVFTDEALTTAYDGGVSAASAGDSLYFTFADRRGSSNDMSKFLVGDILESWIPGTPANLRMMEVAEKTDSYLRAVMLEDDAGSGDTIDDATALTNVSNQWTGYFCEAGLVGNAGVTAATLRVQSPDMPTTMFGPNLLGTVSAPTTTLATSCSPDRPRFIAKSKLYATWTTSSADVRLVLTCDPYYRGGAIR